MLSTFALVGALLGAPTGTIIINVKPADAVVEVDGKVIKAFKSGMAVKVLAGTRKVRARRAGYGSRVMVVKVKEGTKRRVAFKLSKTAVTKVVTKKKTVTITRGPKTVKKKKKTVRTTITPTGKKRKTVVITKGPTTKTPSKGKVVGGKIVTKRPMLTPTGKRKPVKIVRVPARQPPVKKKPVKRKTVTIAKKPAGSKRKPLPLPSRRPKAPPPVREDDGYDDGGYDDDYDDGGRRGRRRGGSMRPLAGLLILAGGAAITGGVIVGLSVQEKADEFDDSVRRREKRELKEEAESRAMIANVLYGVGATGVLLGALLWSADGGTYAEVAPLPGGGGYVGLRGSF